MEKDTLIKVRDYLTHFLSKMDLVETDKVELMININKFLDPNKYEENINVLKKHK